MLSLCGITNKFEVDTKMGVIYYITLIEIITLIIITQLFIPQTNLLNLAGGSAGFTEKYSHIYEITGNLAQTTDPIYETPKTSLEIPAFITDLRTMGTLYRRNHILYLEDASSYIIPDNEVVQWYAEHTVLTDDALLWKHNASIFKFNYVSDNDLFNNPPYDDMWQNPDYYLTHDCKGDCEDFSLAFASILEAKGIYAQVIGVTLINDRNHWVVEYQYNNRTNYADINRNNVIIRHDENPTVYKEWVAIDRNSITKIN